MTEEQKAERRTLIANNKAWASAEVVRREWLTSFLARKTLPKDTAAVIAKGLTIHRNAISAATRDGNTLAHALLGVERGGYWDADKLASIVEATPGKAQHVSLAVVLGAIEATTGKHTWRGPSHVDAAYLTQLTAWGYTLSEVEQIVVDTIEARHQPVDEAPAADADDTADIEADDLDEAQQPLRRGSTPRCHAGATPPQ